MLQQVIAIFSVILPAAATWAQDQAELSPEQQRLAYKQKAEEEAKSLPVVRVADPAELVRFSVKDNHLHIETAVAPNDAERVRYDVPGVGGIVTAQIRGERPDP